MGDLAEVDWGAWSTRFVLFTGKGGVGKTTIASASASASAAAVAMADAGRRVLLVSTDPASNLTDVFHMVTGEHPVPVPGVAGLDIMDLDPHQAADDYRARVIGPYRGVLPDAEVASLEEKLAGACTVEVAAFDTFARLLADPASIGEYDRVVFDTAPTGHTLRLLSLPAAWSDYLGANLDATGCLGPLAGLQDDRPIYAAAVDALKDPLATTVVLVVRPDSGALAVAATAAEELHELGIEHQTLIVNGLLARPLAGDPVAEAYSRKQRRALENIPVALARLPVTVVPLVALDMVGAAALRRLAAPPIDVEPGVTRTLPTVTPTSTGTMTELIGELAQAGRGVILVTGKGGVGKTTVAGLIAVELARRGYPVHLSSYRSRWTCRSNRGGSVVAHDKRDRPGRSNPRLPPRTHEVRLPQRSRPSPSRPARRRPALAVLAGSRHVPSIPPAPRPRPRRVCRHRHGTNRTHPAPARRHRRLPPPSNGRRRQAVRSGDHPVDATPRSRLQQGRHRRARRDDSDR